MSGPDNAAAELSEIFAALEVPIVCRDEPAKGKHLIATKPLPGNTALFEEIPILSWPFAGRRDRFCDVCMASVLPPDVDPKAAAAAAASAPGEKRTFVPCPNSACPALFCSPECAAAAARGPHALLCGAPLATLRAFDQKVYRERCFPSPAEKTAKKAREASCDGAAAAASAAEDDKSKKGHKAGKQDTGGDGAPAAAANQDGGDANDDGGREEEDEDEDEPLDELPVTLEALARAVAFVASRYLLIAAQNPEATPAQLFPHAAQLFNRLIAMPDDASWDEIDAKLWFKTLRGALCTRIEQALLQQQQQSGGGGNNAARKERAKQIIDALVGDVTLNTLLGQLSLNSQAVNLPVMVSADAAALYEEDDDDEEIIGSDGDDDDDDDKAKGSSGKGEQQQGKDTKKKDKPKFVPRPSVGAAVFALHSALNHSCDPNCRVVFGKDHDITVRLLRAVKQGEELTITYIPELYLQLEDYKRRRDRLQSYFFTCACPRCVREEQEERAKEAAAVQEDGGAAAQ